MEEPLKAIFPYTMRSLLMSLDSFWMSSWTHPTVLFSQQSRGVLVDMLLLLSPKENPHIFPLLWIVYWKRWCSITPRYDRFARYYEYRSSIQQPLVCACTLSMMRTDIWINTSTPSSLLFFNVLKPIMYGLLRTAGEGPRKRIQECFWSCWVWSQSICLRSWPATTMLSPFCLIW